MDKNMINIDDLMRRRLGGAEEREPAGAWGAMKDLLDKEMPVQSTAATNWRRMLGYATGLIIAATVTLGGYKMVSSGFTSGNLSGDLNTSAAEKAAASIVKADPSSISNPAATTASNTTTTGSTNTNNTNTASSSATDDHTNGPSGQGNNVATHTSGNHNITGQTGTHSRSASGNSETNNTSVAGSTAASTTTSRTVKTGATGHRSANHNTVAGAGANTANTSTPNTQHHQTGGADPALTAAATQKSITATTAPALGTDSRNSTDNRQTGTASAIPDVADRLAASTGNNSRNNNRSAEPAGVPSSTGQQRNSALTPVSTIIPASGTTTGNNNSMSLAGKLPLKRIDSIHQIEVMYHLEYNPETDKKVYRKDTLGHRKIGVEREMPREQTAINTNDKKLIEENTTTKNRSANNLALSGNTAKAEPATTPVPNASLTAEAVDNNSNLISLSKLRVESKFNRIWDANAQRFNAFVQNVNVAIAKAQFYAGITGGFNTTVFSANTLAGFQLGMTGLLAFNERWSIAADLKYYHRFNTASISDNYLKVSNIIPGNQSTVNGVTFREYTWDQENVIHYYNLTAVQTLELPVTLRRNIGRIFGEAGINMMYSFNINAEEVERSQNNGMTVTKSFPMNTSPGESLGANKHVTLQDFKSRFGLGYVIGAGYEFTPAVNANIRLVQNFWDNASGSSGAAKVSRNLFQTPSVQFSIGYRFSQGRR